MAAIEIGESHSFPQVSSCLHLKHRASTTITSLPLSRVGRTLRPQGYPHTSAMTVPQAFASSDPHASPRAPSCLCLKCAPCLNHEHAPYLDRGASSHVRRESTSSLRLIHHASTTGTPMPPSRVCCTPQPRARFCASAFTMWHPCASTSCIMPKPRALPMFSS